MATLGAFLDLLKLSPLQLLGLDYAALTIKVFIHRRRFVFSQSRPPSLLYDPNMSVCVLGFVFAGVVVLDCVCFGFKVHFYVVLGGF
jgi:hypothetical protein